MSVVKKCILLALKDVLKAIAIVLFLLNLVFTPWFFNVTAVVLSVLGGILGLICVLAGYIGSLEERVLRKEAQEQYAKEVAEKTKKLRSQINETTN